MKAKKYYILKRNSNKLAESYLDDISGKNRDVCLKRFGRDSKKDLILIEKTCVSDFETYTDLWFFDDSSTNPWDNITKGKLMYDYTGVVNPLIHVDGNVYTFKRYNENIISKRVNSL